MNANRGSQESNNTPETGNLHFRLCHICLNLNESEEDIEECEKCQHVFKDEALMQFFDDNDQHAFSDQIDYPPQKVSETQEEAETEGTEELGQVNGLNARF